MRGYKAPSLHLQTIRRVPSEAHPVDTRPAQAHDRGYRSQRRLMACDTETGIVPEAYNIPALEPRIQYAKTKDQPEGK